MKILIAGGEGQLGTALRQHPQIPQLEIICPPETDFDSTRAGDIDGAIENSGAEVVVNRILVNGRDVAKDVPAS